MPPLTDRSWLWLAASFYFAAFALGTFRLFRQGRHSGRLITTLLVAACLLQTTGLYVRGLAVKGCPLGNTFELFQFTAWSAIVLHLAIGTTFRLSLLGYFNAMLSTVLTVVSLAIPAWDTTRRINAFEGQTWIEFHAALALFSYGVFALLALTAGMYVLQVFSLRAQQLRGFFAFLPSIRDLDQINVRLLGFGVLLLSASLGVGAVYWLQEPARVAVWKLTATVAVWAAYALVWVLRLRQQLLATRLAWTCMVLFAAALLSLLVVDASRSPLVAARAAGGAGGGEGAGGRSGEGGEGWESGGRDRKDLRDPKDLKNLNNNTHYAARLGSFVR